MTLHVQNYLRSGKTLDELRVEHGVKSFLCNGKIGFTYDQIEARESDPLSQQCRGLILREKTFDVVAAPLFRFFNIEQIGVAAPVDFNTASIEEKLDGTLIIVYFDHEAQRWYCATRSRPEADGSIDASNLTFTDLLQSTIEKTFGRAVANLQEMMLNMPKMKTYCFELCTPVNRIVCAYDDFSITLLAVRDNESLLEEDPDSYADQLVLKRPKRYHFDSIENLLKVIRDWDPKEHEGVIVKDANFNRVKIKSPAYVAYNHLRDRLSTSIRGCMELIILEKDDDIIGMVPEFIADRIQKMKSAFRILISDTERQYSEIKDIEDMKEFALRAQKCMWPSAMFMMKRGKVGGVKDFIQKNADSNSSLDSMFNMLKKIDSTLGQL